MQIAPKQPARRAPGFTAHEINFRHRMANPPRTGGFIGRYNRRMARALKRR